MSTRVVRAFVACGLAEDADAVGDGLGAGHGRAAVGEGAQQEEGRDAEDQPAAGVPERQRCRGCGGWCGRLPAASRTRPTTISTAMLAMKK